MDGLHDGSEARLAHVLFVDLVGSSLWPLDDQVRRAADLMAAIRAIPEFEAARAAGECAPVPSGDGVALAFTSTATVALACAIQLRSNTAERSVRYGVHSGPVAFGADIRGAGTVFGDGINGAKRAMDCARPGELIATEAFVAQLDPGDLGFDRLRDAGVVVAKHGTVMRIHRWVDGDVEFVAKSVRPTGTGGGLELDSDRYVPRAIDGPFLDAFRRRDGVIRLKGPRQCGKTTLIARTLAAVRAEGVSVVVSDLQSQGVESVAGIDGFCRRLAEQLADDLNLDGAPAEQWSDVRSPEANLERYLRRAVLPECQSGLVWAFDEADRLFGFPWASSLFSLFRSWHNRRALDPEGPWRRLTIGIVHAAEAHRVIADPNQSPFNVGTPFQLGDFTWDEANRLPAVCGASIADTEWKTWFHWVDGHPHLCQLGLDAFVEGTRVTELLDMALDTARGPVGDHLEHVRATIMASATDLGLVQAILADAPVVDGEAFLRLRAMGIVSGDDRRSARLRCPLYAQFLKRWLE